MKKLLSLVALLSVGACSNTAPEPGGSGPVFVSTPGGVTKAARGFKQTLRTSRFAIGQSNFTDVVAGSDRTVGSYGVFTVDRASGVAMGISNADSPALQRPAFSNVGESHNKKVIEYLVAAGLPADQILTSSANATMSVFSKEGDDPRYVAPTFEHYTTVIRRQIEGFMVFESVAAVRFNVDGDVVAESIYWPEIDFQAVTDAKALLAKEQSGSAMAERIPADYDRGEVVIHHTPMLRSPMRAYALYTAHPIPGTHDMPSDKHWDIDGHEVKLDFEATPFSGKSSRNPRISIQ